MATHMKKQFLMIAYYFPPLGGGGTLRTLKYVKYLPQYGWLPEVLTVKNPHYLVMNPELSRNVPPEVFVHRTSAFLPGRFFRRLLSYDQAIQDDDVLPSKATLRNRFFAVIKGWIYTLFFVPDEYIGWLPFSVVVGLRLIKKRKLSVIYTTSPPNSLHLIGFLLKKIFPIRWIADFRDLWDQYPDSYNPYYVRWKTSLDKFFEHLVLRSADRIILVSEIMKRQLLQKYPDIASEKYKVITNGFDPDDFKDVQPGQAEPSHFTILHTGTLFSWRRSTCLFETFSSLLDSVPEFSAHVKLRLMGIVHQDVRREIARHQLNPAVEIIPYQPYNEMIRQLKSADYLLLIIGNQPKAANVLTLKLFDYIGAQKPILALAPDGEVSRLIRTHKLGLVARPDDHEEIRKMFLFAFHAWQSNRSPVPEDNFNKIMPVFDRRNLTGRLANVLKVLDET